ncbi:hypothetical protein D3C71_1260180 [compost metagenome]
MGMDDATDIGPLTVDPEVKTHGRVGRAFALQHFHAVIDANHRCGPDLIESLSQCRGEEGAVVVTHRNLSSQRFGMPFAGQDATAQGDFLLHAPVAEIQFVGRAFEKRIGLALLVFHTHLLKGPGMELHRAPRARRLTAGALR